MIRDQERISLGQVMATTLLVLAGVLLFFYHLGKTGFDRETPARIAVYASEMNKAGDWVAPVVRGQARVDVPPLYLWATKIFSGLSTEVSAFQERTPGALCAIALIMLAAWWLYRHASRYSREDMAEASPEGFALLAGLILASNPVLFSTGRMGTLHTMFVLLYAGAAFCWSESLEARRSFYAGQPWRNWILWGYALAGLAMLVRGPLVLPLLWVPYWLASHSYHLRRMDLVHIPGLLLALLIGASWPLLVTLFHHEAAPGLWREWLTLRFGNLDAADTSFYEYLKHILVSSFPWNLLAIVMVVSVWRRKDRSPTLVFLVSSLVGNLLVLTFLSDYVGQHRLPVIFFISLLAAEAVYRWNFETPWASAWRTLLRVLIIGGVLVSIFASILLKSNLGVGLFALVPVAWAAWAIRSRISGVVYTPWEAAVRLGALLVCLLIAAEAVLLAEYEPKRDFYNEKLAYFNRIRDRIEDSDSAAILQKSAEMDFIYDYHLGGVAPLLNKPVSELRARPEQDLYLCAEENLKGLFLEPSLEPSAIYWNGDHTQPRDAMFRVLTRYADPASSATVTTTSQPWRVALLGNQGTRTKDQTRVSKRLDKVSGRRPVGDVLLLGNNIYGNSVLNHLDIVDSFEKPYRSLLNRGVTFHAALGHEDQSYPWLQTRYPAFNMNNRRYYAFTTGPGNIDVFMLDAERLYRDKQFDEPQLKWLESALAKSAAPWKVIGLSQPLASANKGANVQPELAARLLPLIDKYKVNLVAWAGGVWYERLALPGHNAVFLNAGWSGNNRDTLFNTADPRLKVAYDDRPGFVILEFSGKDAVVNAVNDRGRIVDQVRIPAGGGAPVPLLATPAPGTLTPSGAAQARPSTASQPVILPAATPAATTATAGRTDGATSQPRANQQ